MAREIPTQEDLEYGPQDWSGGFGVYEKIHAERVRAHGQHDSNGGSMERKHWNDIKAWVNVTVEEVGEVSKAINERLASRTDFDEYKAELRKEVLQCAAMYTAWLAAIDDEDQAYWDHETGGEW